MWRGFRELYLTADRRVLGLARIAFGLVLIYDLARRARVLELFYTNYGVLSNHYLLFQPQAQPQFSLLTALSTTGEATFAFGLIAFVYSLYTLGLCTRVAQLLALLSLTSLNARNLFLEDSGISTMIAFGTWSAFLPLGDRFSLDALRREAKLPNIRARVGLRNELRQPAVSLAVLALTLQIIAIYWLSAVQKTGATWRHGDAVHDVLWQNRLATPLSWWLAQHEPAWFSPFATRATLALEYAIPVLVLYASSRVARTLAFGLAVALHGAIALIMTLGPFPYAMLTLVLTCVPGNALVWLAGRIPLPVRRRLTRLHVHLVRTLARYLRQGAPARAPLRPLAWMKLREACVACVMLAALVELTQANQAFKLKLPQPEWLRALTFYPRLTQRWSMFAPDAPTDDGYGVVDAVTAGHRHIDPFTEKPPDFELFNRGPLPHPIEVSDYLFSISLDANERYRRELARYLEHWQEHRGRVRADKIVSYQVWWLNRATPPRGATAAGKTERRLLLKSRDHH